MSDVFHVECRKRANQRKNVEEKTKIVIYCGRLSRIILIVYVVRDKAIAFAWTDERWLLLKRSILFGCDHQCAVDAAEARKIQSIEKNRLIKNKL